MIKKIKEQKLNLIREIRRYFQIFIILSKFSLKTTFQARFGIILFALGKLLRFFLTFGFVFLIFSRTKNLYGYNLPQAMIFFMTFNLIDSTAQLLFREVYRFRPLIISGGFDLILVKPFHPFLRILFGGIDYMDAINILIYWLIILIFALQLKTVTLINIILYLLLLVNSLIIAGAFHIVVLALGILLTNVDHTIMIYRDLTSIAKFPLDIYRQPIRFIFTFVFPAFLMFNLPAQTLGGKININLIGLAFLASLFFLALALWGWKKALQYYQSWGG
jgi:ABC-2 type transport system permease protein